MAYRREGPETVGTETPKRRANVNDATVKPGALLRVEGVSKSFGAVKALDDVTLEVEDGAVFGLLGPNGAGKTTLVHVLTTLLRPDAGRASVAGFDLARDPKGVRTMIGLAGQFAAVDENLTGRENLQMVGRLYHLSRKEARRRAGEVLESFGLIGAADRSVKGYSGGMRRRLDLGASLVGRPRVLFLDEPTTGLDPQSRNDLWNIIENLADGGTTIMLTTQYMEEAERLADYLTVVDGGRVIARGTPAELKKMVGGERLVVRPWEPEDAPRAARLLAPLAENEPETNEEGLIVLNVARRPGLVAEAVRALDVARIGIAELALREPTLDDVFLSLTGRSVEGESPDGGIDQETTARGKTEKTTEKKVSGR